MDARLSQYKNKTVLFIKITFPHKKDENIHHYSYSNTLSNSRRITFNTSSEQIILNQYYEPEQYTQHLFLHRAYKKTT